MTYIYVCVYIYIVHMFAMQYRTDTLKPSSPPPKRL